MDYAELSQRAKEGKPLYGESDQPLWVQGAAHNNSVFSQLKMRMSNVYCVPCLDAQMHFSFLL